MRLILALLLAFAPVSLAARPANDGGANAVTPILAEAGPGTRWGLVVADADGREIVALNPEGRFVPASNTKLYTTAAALWAEARGEGPKLAESGTYVRLFKEDVFLVGRGDARLSSRPECVTDCLATLANAIAARTRRVRDLIGSAQTFPDERWSPGMSWNNIPSSSGTAIAALVVDNNEIAATVAPGSIGQPPVVSAGSYYTVDNRATTVAGEGETLAYDRLPNSRMLVVTGTIGVGHPPVAWRLGIDDPAYYAAWRLAEMLRARGVAITGELRSGYRPLEPWDDPKLSHQSPIVLEHPRGEVEATLTPGPLGEVIDTVNKQSQNLHAELLLRRLGLARGGSGSIAAGQAMVTAMLTEAGVSPLHASLSDGSGMSTYNRVAPRGTVRLLQWAARQPWAKTFRDSLPIGGVDGTLRRRFAGTPLAGKIFAKTGTLNATNALAGWLVAASGRELTFAIYANDVPEGVPATAIMDRALLALAAAN